jgi:4-azaleucine resistance transporter AzlC
MDLGARSGRVGLPPADLRAGARDAAPIIVGLLPFGLVAGYAALEAGLSPAQAVGLSTIVFAGASQIAVIELLGADAPLTVAVATAVVINARLLMYSASIAPYFRAFRTRTKALLAYVLTDQAFALSVSTYRDPDRDVDRRAYYLGAAGSIWIAWQVATVAGVLLGTGVPSSWGLAFAAPLVFLALLVPAVGDRPSAAAAVVGGGVALLARNVPSDAGLLIGGVAGVAAGLAVERGTDATGTHGGHGAGVADGSGDDATDAGVADGTRDAGPGDDR